ncbi:flavin-containing monooxygenase 5-like [Uloborus diversus]|uniref:flavin-containing monooxygenase 5-like n=1 Tax=Uloborus diversus TaxID=327109 RepID=UPI00240A0AEB|nr:flavin-containing monooxygenase 5-like [Uloborus diversus]XP_054708732.1 flavin-containing monooxygenase 5-like [Uloborus diversus]
MKRVAIIGAGSAGLAAAKACREEGIDFVVFERSGRVAGLWNYREEDVDGQASVMKTTVINSSKEMSAFSDFPPPKEFPNYMHNRMMCKYFHMYAEKFDLLDNIRYYQEVIKVVQAPDYDATGRLVVTAQNTNDKSTTVETFDGVMVCTGHHGYPHVPKFKGQEDFKGKIVHTHSIRVPDAFKDQKVLIIGVGNSGLDASVDISNVAKQVYLSTRRGTWIMFRLGKYGLPADTQFLTRFFDFVKDICGWNIANSYIERYLDSKFNHEIYNLKPKHRYNAQHLAINDHLPNKILAGTVIVKGDVDHFTEKGVIFKGEENVTKIDSIVLATGYKIKYPFLSDKILDTTNNKADLYKFVFPPGLKHSSLAIIGLIQPFGSLFPIFEIQSRWYAQLLNGKVKFPSPDLVLADVQKKKKELAERYVGTPRHTVQVDYIAYMDEIASQFGARPNLKKMALTDPLLFYHCFMGPCTPYQYRLEGPHAWPEARRTIITTNERIMKPLNTRNGKLVSDHMGKYLMIWIISFFILCFALFLVHAFA